MIAESLVRHLRLPGNVLPSQAGISAGRVMIVVIDERESVGRGFVAQFRSLGVAATDMSVADCRDWLSGLHLRDAGALDAVIVGACAARAVLPRTVRGKSDAAVIAVNEDRALSATLALFDVGYDDVVVPPMHAQEIVARVHAIKRRHHRLATDLGYGRRLVVHQDGRDPEIDGEPLALTRRERSVLACLAGNEGRWVSKTRLFNAVYGPMPTEVGEQAVESHICRLRARLRTRLGRDPVRAQRYSGYRLVLP